MTTRFPASTWLSTSSYLQLILAVCVLLAVPSIAPAQWRKLMNPQIPVSIEHPPKYILSTDKIIVAPAVGACGDDITSELIAGFAERESEVLGPEDLALILKVLDLSARSGYSLDKAAALAVGQHVSTADINLASGNLDSYGITFGNGRFFVVDAISDKVFTY